MMKKIIAIVLVVLFGCFLIFFVPKMIADKKAREEKKAQELQKRAEKRAEQTIGDKIGVTGGNAGFGGKYSEKAKDNADRASHRSADFLEQMEEE